VIRKEERKKGRKEERKKSRKEVKINKQINIQKTTYFWRIYKILALAHEALLGQWV
jgi:hypothetical protein